MHTQTFREIEPGTKFTFASLPEIVCGKLDFYTYVILKSPNPITEGNKIHCYHQNSKVHPLTETK